MRTLRRLGLVALALLLLAALVLAVQSRRRPDLAPFQDLTLPAAAPVKGQLRLRFAGVSTLLFDDGETAWITDGFFSRPGLASMLTTRIAPDPARIDAGLQALGVTRLAAVIPLHSHYDHALDAPAVALRSGALLMGSASTLQIGRGAGLAEGQMKEIRPGDTLRLGRFTLSFFASRHSPTAWSDGQGHEEIAEPLAPPAHASAWREGTVFALLVEHEGRRLWVQSSAGFIPGAFQGQRADTLLLGIGTLGKKDATYRAAYWQALARTLDARRVIPIHWDDFWQPLDVRRPLEAMPYLFDDTGLSLAELRERARTEGRELRLPPLFVPFDPFTGKPDTP